MKALQKAMLPLLVCVSGCVLGFQESPPAQSTCDEARNLLFECGASLALFERTRCAGPSLFAAECVLDHGGACEDLSSLGEACARVVSDAIDEVDPPEVPGDECRPPAALAPGTLFTVDTRVHRVDGLAYCACTETPVAEEDLCAPPLALVSSGICSSPCVESVGEAP